MTGYLKLDYIGLSVTIDHFGARNYPRERIELPKLGRSTYGAITLDGLSFEAPHVWEVQAELNANQLADLEAMHGVWAQQKTALTITDTMRLFSEVAPRTRAIAPNTTQRTAGTAVQYYAQFNAQFQTDLAIAKIGSRDDLFTVAFTLQETGVVAA